MKTKLISLIAALLCLTMLFVSCSDEEECKSHIDADNDGICDVENCQDEVKKPEVTCTEHKDEDKDGMCDTENCDTAVIINTVTNEVEIVVPTTPEEKVEMVVKPIPSDSVFTDYFTYDYKTNTVYLNSVAAEAIKYADIIDGLGDGRIFVFKTTKTVVEAADVDDPATEDVDETYEIRQDTYTLYDIVNDKNVLVYNTDEYDYKADVYDGAPYVDIQYEDDLFILITEGVKGYVYTVSGESIVEFEDIRYIDEPEIDDYTDPNYTYVEVEGITYVIDVESAKLVYSANSDLLVKRPVFTSKNDKLGIVKSYNAIQFYDITKWLSLSYEYQAPEYAEDISMFVLQNGNYLVQYVVELANNAVSYDYKENGDCYDIVYVIVDPAAKTSTEVEFGYYIEDSYENDNATDKALNMFEVVTVKGGYLYEDKILVVDNQLNVLCELKANVAGQTSPSYNLVANNLAIVEIKMGDTYVSAVVNDKGEIKAYLPANYTAYDGYIEIDDVLYNYDLTVKFDYKKDGYVIVDEGSKYWILTKTEKVMVEEVETNVTKTYFYNPSLAAPVEIQLKNETNVNQETGVVVTVQEYITSIFTDAYVKLVQTTTTTPPAVEGGVPSIAVKEAYELYNANNVKIATFDKPVMTINFDSEAGMAMVICGSYMDMSSIVIYRASTVAPAPAA